MHHPVQTSPVLLVRLLFAAVLLCGLFGACDESDTQAPTSGEESGRESGGISGGESWNVSGDGWSPVAVGSELSGWTLVEERSHPEFLRYSFEDDGERTTIEVNRGSNSGYVVQGAPGSQPPEALVSALRAALESAPDSLLAPRSPRPPESTGATAGSVPSGESLDPWQMRLGSALHCLPAEEADELLADGILRDWSRVTNSSWRTSAILVGSALVLGLLGLWRRRSRWLGGPSVDTQIDDASIRTDYVVAAVLAAAACAVFLPFVLAVAGNPPWAGADTEIYTSLFWNAAHGRGLYNAYEAMDHLGSHNSVGLYLLVPFYALFPGQSTIVVMNTVLIVGSVAPLYLLARTRLSRPYSVGIAVLFLGFPALDGMLREMHAVKVAIPLLIWALYFLVRRRSVLFVIMICLATLFKENVAIVLFGIAAYLAVERETRWAAAFVATLGVAVYFVGAHVVIPAHYGDFGSGSLERYDHFGGGLAAVALSPIAQPGVLFHQLTEPQSLIYLCATLLPLALLPVLAPREALIAVPVIAQNVLSNSVFMRSSEYHYDSLLLPGLFFAAVVGLARIPEGRPRLAAFLIALVATGILDTRIGQSDPWRWESSHTSETAGELAAFIATVPEGSSLSSPGGLAPFVQRRTLLTRGAPGSDPHAVPEFRIVYERDSAGMPENFERISSGAGYALYRDTRTLDQRCRSMLEAAGR